MKQLAGRLGSAGNKKFIRVAAVVVFAAILHTGCKNNSVTSRPSESVFPAQTPSQPANGRRPPEPPLVCPLFGSVPVSATIQRGGHKVILSWNASTADSKHGAAVGYCIYRATKPNGPPTELVNPLPFSGTGCMDDLVDNGKTYYYVVRAINAHGATSIHSRPAPARIPDSPPKSNISGDSAPLCRQAPAQK